MFAEPKVATGAELPTDGSEVLLFAEPSVAGEPNVAGGPDDIGAPSVFAEPRSVLVFGAPAGGG